MKFILVGLKINCILNLAINTVTIKNLQNITLEFGIYDSYTIIHCVFLFSRQYIVKHFVIKRTESL